MDYKIPKNVNDFINKCAKEIGKFEADNFESQTWEWCSSFIESPIEQILYCAMRFISYLNLLTKDDMEFAWGHNGEYKQTGIEIESQTTIDKYRVDFLISYFRIKNTKQIKKSIIIECDSQEWHERTEKERRYEKTRDRYLQLKDYKIFHYTGSEIIRNPLKIAQEIISYITDISIEDLQLDSNILED